MIDMEREFEELERRVRRMALLRAAGGNQGGEFEAELSGRETRRREMRISLAPFPGAAWVDVPVTPMGYVLMVGKFWDCAPGLVPSIDVSIRVFVDLPGRSPAEGLQWLESNVERVQRRAAEWLIAPDAN